MAKHQNGRRVLTKNNVGQLWLLLALFAGFLCLGDGSQIAETAALAQAASSTGASSGAASPAATASTSAPIAPTTQSPVVNGQAVEAATAEALGSLADDETTKTIIVLSTSDNTTSHTTTTTTTPAPLKTIVVKEKADGSVVSIVSHHATANHKHSGKSISTSDKLHKFDLFIDPVCEQLAKLTEKQLNKVQQQLRQFSSHTSDNHLSKCFAAHGFHSLDKIAQLLSGQNPRDCITEFCSARATNSDAYKLFMACAARDWPSAVDKEIEMILKDRIRSSNKSNSATAASAKDSELSSAEKSLIDDIVAHLHDEQVQEIASELAMEQKQLAEASAVASTTSSTTTTTTSAPWHKSTVAAHLLAASHHHQPLGKLNQLENNTMKLASGGSTESSPSIHHHQPKTDAIPTVATTVTASAAPTAVPVAVVQHLSPASVTAAATAAATATGSAAQLPGNSATSELHLAPITLHASGGFGESVAIDSNHNLATSRTSNEQNQIQQPTTHSPSVLLVGHDSATAGSFKRDSSNHLVATDYQQQQTSALRQQTSDFMGQPIAHMSEQSSNFHQQMRASPSGNDSASATSATATASATSGPSGASATSATKQWGSDPSHPIEPPAVMAVAGFNQPTMHQTGLASLPTLNAPNSISPVQKSALPNMIDPIPMNPNHVVPNSLEDAMKLLNPIGDAAVAAAAGVFIAKSTTPAPFGAGSLGGPTVSPLANILLNSIDFVTSRKPTSAPVLLPPPPPSSHGLGASAGAVAAAAVGSGRSGLLDAQSDSMSAPVSANDATSTTTAGSQLFLPHSQSTAPTVITPGPEVQTFLPAPPLSPVEPPATTAAPLAATPMSMGLHLADSQPTMGAAEVAAGSGVIVSAKPSAKIEPTVWSNVNSALEILSHPNSVANGTVTLPKVSASASDTATTTTFFVGPEVQPTTAKPSASITKTETSMLTDLLAGTGSKPEIKVIVVGDASATTTNKPGSLSIESVNHTVEVETSGGKKKSISHAASFGDKMDEPHVHEVIVMGEHVEGDDLMHDYDDHSEHLGEHEDHGDGHDHHDHHDKDDVQIEHKVSKKKQKSGKKSLSLEEELEEKRLRHLGGGGGGRGGVSDNSDDHSDHEHLLEGLLAGDVIHVDAGEMDKI